MRKKVFPALRFTDAQTLLERIGTPHEERLVIFDNDTRLLFATIFDGDWDSYIDDFLRPFRTNWISDLSFPDKLDKQLEVLVLISEIGS